MPTAVKETGPEPTDIPFIVFASAVWKLKRVTNNKTLLIKTFGFNLFIIFMSVV